MKTQDYYFDKDMDGSVELFHKDRLSSHNMGTGVHESLGVFTAMLSSSLSLLRNGSTLHIRVDIEQ